MPIYAANESELEKLEKYTFVNVRSPPPIMSAVMNTNDEIARIPTINSLRVCRKDSGSARTRYITTGSVRSAAPENWLKASPKNIT